MLERAVGGAGSGCPEPTPTESAAEWGGPGDPGRLRVAVGTEGLGPELEMLAAMSGLRGDEPGGYVIPSPRACLTMCVPAWLQEVPLAGAVRAAYCVMGLRLCPALGICNPLQKPMGPRGLQVYWMGQEGAQHPAAQPRSSS